MRTNLEDYYLTMNLHFAFSQFVRFCFLSCLSFSVSFVPIQMMRWCHLVGVSWFRCFVWKFDTVTLYKIASNNLTSIFYFALQKNIYEKLWSSWSFSGPSSRQYVPIYAYRDAWRWCCELKSSSSIKFSIWFSVTIISNVNKLVGMHWGLKTVINTIRIN